MSDLKSKTEKLKEDMLSLMNTYTKETNERIGMIDIYKNENDDYIVKPILGEPEYEY